MKISDIIEIKLKRIIPNFGDNEMLLSENDLPTRYQIAQHPNESKEAFLERQKEHNNIAD